MMRARVCISSDEQLGLLTNIGVLSALILTIVISSQTSVTLDEWYNRDYRWNLRTSAEYRLRVLQYLTTAGQNLSVIDAHGPLNISGVLSENDIPSLSSGRSLKKNYEDKIYQIDRVFHATSDDVPNIWKFDNREVGYYTLEARFWLAVTLLGLSSIGSLMLYAAINLGELKEREEEATQKLWKDIIAELKGLRSDLAKRRLGNARSRSRWIRRIQMRAGKPSRILSHAPAAGKVEASCSTTATNGNAKIDPRTCVKCFNSVWEYAPSGLTVSIIILAFSLAYGTHLALWGLYDIGLVRFPHHVSNELMFDFYVTTWGWIVLVIYFVSSVLTFLSGNKISFKLMKKRVMLKQKIVPSDG